MFLQANLSLAPACRRAALAIAGTTSLVLVALSHHPVANKASTVQESLVKLAELQLMDGVVHGLLMIILAVLASGFAMFSVVLGRQRPPVIVAMTAYGLGCCIVVAAMLLDGFVVPQLATNFVSAPETDIQVVHVILRVIGTVIQVLTKAGLLAMCAALLAWSYALATMPSPASARWCAAVGAIGGLGSGLVILFGDILLTPGSLMALFGVQAVWNFGVAGLLFQSSRTRN
ncbi:MAG: hypothetical protein V4633_00340 [Pseudomonadota bacterium]